MRRPQIIVNNIYLYSPFGRFFKIDIVLLFTTMRLVLAEREWQPGTGVHFTAVMLQLLQRNFLYRKGILWLQSGTGRQEISSLWCGDNSASYWGISQNESTRSFSIRYISWFWSRSIMRHINPWISSHQNWERFNGVIFFYEGTGISLKWNPDFWNRHAYFWTWILLCF